MSVPLWRRLTHGNTKEDWQDATTAAEKLFKHTMQRINGQEGRAYFSKSETFTKRFPLLKTARKIYRLCKKANLIFPTKPRHFKQRRKKIEKALCLVDDMYTFLTLFNEDKQIKNCEHWVKLINDTGNLLGAWLKSDDNRKKKMKDEKRALRYSLRKGMKELKALP